MGVRKSDGSEYGFPENPVYVDVELGEDWSANDLTVVYVSESEDEHINFEVLNSLYIFKRRRKNCVKFRSTSYD